MGESNYDLKNLFKKYGGWVRIFKSFDFIFAFIFAMFVFCYMTWPDATGRGYFAKELASVLLNISASLFGILFAAFAIILSLSDEKFIKFLRKHNVLDKILFPFWFISFLYIINIALDILIKFFPDNIAKYFTTISILLFFWAIFGTAYLISDTVSFGIRRADYLEFEKEIGELTKDTKQTR
ncbi:MAG: hypothetical protein PHS66_02060 [Candidatus Omnitrophica bacterium]|nr:hypothetical protein [Candidatus Omnitrophota bacterium]